MVGIIRRILCHDHCPNGTFVIVTATII